MHQSCLPVRSSPSTDGLSAIFVRGTGSLIAGNTIGGAAQDGIALTFRTPFPEVAGNLLLANHFRLFEPREADILFGPDTHDNVVLGAPALIVDQGTNNHYRLREQ